jgi:hypothetical protein
MHKIIQLISNFLYNKNMPFFVKVVTRSLDELDEKTKSYKNFKILKFQKKRLKSKGLVTTLALGPRPR